ncbi:MAG: glycosyltransferase [Chloroflexi bacterium]|nr:glycosyltransferase [Chloroflexota bacterium]
MRCPGLMALPAPPLDRRGWPWTEESAPLPATMPDGRPWPPVSIVTPSFNQAPFIEETIRSVLLQGYPNLEYIVVDGGSTDGSVEIIRRYADHLAWWVSEPDGGQANAINKGWSRARGEIVAFLNSDDTYQAEAIAAAVRHLVAQPEAGMVCGSGCLADLQGRPFAEIRQPFDLGRFLLWQVEVVQPAVFIRRSALDAVGLLDERLHYALDYELWLRIALRFPVASLPTRLANTRYYAGTKSMQQQARQAAEALAVWERFFQQELPSSIASLRPRAIAQVSISKGYAHYVAGEMSIARDQALAAIRLAPTPHIIRRALILFAKTLLGHRLSNMLRQTRRIAARERLALAGRVKQDISRGVWRRYWAESPGAGIDRSRRG